MKPAKERERDRDREKGYLLPSLNNPSGLVSANSLASLPPAYDNPAMRPAAAPAAFPSPVAASATVLLGVPAATSSLSPSAGALLPPRPAKLSDLDLLDPSVTGSTDLSGEKKPRIDHHRAPDSSVLEEKYMLGRKLGQGSFGTVRLAEEKATGITWAIKSIRKAKGSTERIDQLAREVGIMKRVNHPHIVQLREVIETPNKIHLVMEYCRGGELVRRVAQKRYCSEQDCRIIMTRLLEAVAYLHDHGVVHRDLKPENVLLSTADPNDQLNIKVSDFGLATFSGACKMMENICGTPFYMAPEIVSNLGYSHQCDVWSLGVMMYLLLCGYRRDCEHALQKMIADYKVEFVEPMNEEVSPAAKDLLQRMLQFDPAQRITAREALQHPWTNGKEEASVSVGQTTVLQMMKSYNAERRLKRVINVVLAAVRFQRGGEHGSIDLESERSDDGVASEEEIEMPAVSRDHLTEHINEMTPVVSSESITGASGASGNSGSLTEGVPDVPLVVPPTTTNRIKRPTTATRLNQRSKVRGYSVHGVGSGGMPRTSSQSPQVSSDDIVGEKQALSPSAISSSALGLATPLSAIKRALANPVSHRRALPRTSSGELPSHLTSLSLTDRSPGRARRNSTPGPSSSVAAFPRRRTSAFIKETGSASSAANGSAGASSGFPTFPRRRTSSIPVAPTPVTATNKAWSVRKSAR